MQQSRMLCSGTRMVQHKCSDYQGLLEPTEVAEGLLQPWCPEGTNVNIISGFSSTWTFLFLPLPHTNAHKYLDPRHMFCSIFIWGTFCFEKVSNAEIEKIFLKQISSLFFVRQRKSANKNKGTKGSF